MRVAAVFVLIVCSIIALCGAEDSSDSSISLLEREAREAASSVRQKKTKNGKRIKKKKKTKKSGKIKKKENSKTKKRNNKKGKDLQKNKFGKNKKRKIKRKNEKKRRMKKGSNKKKSNAKKRNRKQKKATQIIKPNHPERSLKNTCTDKEKDKARTVVGRAKRIKSWYNTLTSKANKGGVFANYSRTLAAMTSNGTVCGPTARYAYEFLSNCSATAKSICDPSGDFATSYTVIVEKENCSKTVNCSYFPQECTKPKIDVTYEGLKELKNQKCLNKDFPGSFSNCMKFVKDLGTDIISDCVAKIKESIDGTCDGIVESGSEIIELTNTVPPITTRSLSGRSRKRFY